MKTYLVPLRALFWISIFAAITCCERSHQNREQSNYLDKNETPNNKETEANPAKSTNEVRSKLDYPALLREDFRGKMKEYIKHRLGPPEYTGTISDQQRWSYGPDLKDLTDAKSGAIIGINIFFESSGLVSSVTGIYK